MEELTLKMQTMQQALTQLIDALNLFKTNTLLLSPLHKDLMREGVIQRFEYSSELFWRFIKAHIESIHGNIPGEQGARSIIRFANKIGIISEVETLGIIKIIEDRNRTSHVYLESVALQISAQIPAHAELMHTIVQRIVVQYKEAVL